MPPDARARSQTSAGCGPQSPVALSAVSTDNVTAHYRRGVRAQPAAGGGALVFAVEIIDGFALAEWLAELARRSSPTNTACASPAGYGRAPRPPRDTCSPHRTDSTRRSALLSLPLFAVVRLPATGCGPRTAVGGNRRRSAGKPVVGITAPEADAGRALGADVSG